MPVLHYFLKPCRIHLGGVRSDGQKLRVVFTLAIGRSRAREVRLRLYEDNCRIGDRGTACIGYVAECRSGGKLSGGSIPCGT